jgi:hypothetical protein
VVGTSKQRQAKHGRHDHGTRLPRAPRLPPSLLSDGTCRFAIHFTTVRPLELALRPPIITVSPYSRPPAVRCSPSCLRLSSSDQQPQHGHPQHPACCAPTTTPVTTIIIRCAPNLNKSHLLSTLLYAGTSYCWQEVDKRPRGYLSHDDNSKSPPTSPHRFRLPPRFQAVLAPPTCT